MNKPISLHWFRRDLRVSDNPALLAAAEKGNVLPIFILNQGQQTEHPMGEASRWWLHHSLNALNHSLGGNLQCFVGDELEVLNSLCAKFNIENVFWNRCYEPESISRDTKIKSKLKELGVSVQSFNGSLLKEPQSTLKPDALPYKVFTPFYKKHYASIIHEIGKPLPSPKKTSYFSGLIKKPKSLNIDALALKPSIKWYSGLDVNWQPGEQGARDKLNQFFDDGLPHYKVGRDFPAKNSVTKLSPHLTWGEISPRQILHELKLFEPDGNSEHLTRELVWREFSYSLLFHNPDIPSKCFNKKFEHFSWSSDEQLLDAWRKGQTGYPIIDAGMRELWQTGYMHNRVRMITASFLVKNLMQPWQSGASWFWDCLVDADLANNSAGWQWVAGCGADAAPYFRIFNPITQGEKFDPDGYYTRRYVPELSTLPNKFLFKPWQAPKELLTDQGITLGETYPLPIVDVKASRESALLAYKNLKEYDAIA